MGVGGKEQPKLARKIQKRNNEHLILEIKLPF